MSAEVESKLKEIMASLLTIEPALIDDQTSIETVELWDSLNHMNLMAGIEETFKVTLSTEEIIEGTSYEAICRVLKRHGVDIL